MIAVAGLGYVKQEAEQTWTAAGAPGCQCVGVRDEVVLEREAAECSAAQHWLEHQTAEQDEFDVARWQVGFAAMGLAGAHGDRVEMYQCVAVPLTAIGRTCPCAEAPLGRIVAMPPCAEER